MLGDAFETRPNGLNAVRLALASTVILWHSLLMTSPHDFGGAAWQALNQGAVDGFFAMSGFLIVGSWERRPDAAAFVRARLGRLLPGLWVCLVLTAFVVAPISAGSVDLGEQLRYVVDNAGVLVTHPTIGETPVPTWNLSLWSLWPEVICYAAVLGLGVRGLLRVPLLCAAAAICWLWMLTLTLTGTWNYTASGAMIAPRLGFMFALGALAYLLRDRLPSNGRLAGSAAGLLALSMLTPNYHLLGGPALAYLVLWAGMGAGRFERLRLSNDLSYGVYIYGAPLMLALVMTGAVHTWWTLAVLATVGVLPVAALSWVLVERPVVHWARRNGRPARIEPSVAKQVVP